MRKRVKRNTYLTYGHKFDGETPDYSSMSFGKALGAGMGKVNLGTLGGSIGGAFKGSGAGAIGSAIGGAVGGLIGGGYQSGAGDVFNKIGDIGSAIPGPWGAIIGGGAKILGGLTNAAFGSKVDQEKLNAANEGTATLNSFKSNAESFDDIKGVQAVANVQDAYKGGWFAKGSARKKNEELRRQRAQAMSFADRSVENNVENLANEQMDNMLANYAAFGGPLHTNGADWNTGITIVDNGGSHESNPLEGVPMGMAPDGTPNLVEEGEVIFNDYVFSKRLKVPKAVREKYKLRGTKDLTFADAAKKAQKESEERPNDPISRRGLEAAMQGLMVEQENVRQKKAERESKKAVFAYGGNLFACGGKKYACGGKFGHKYQGKGVQPQQMFKRYWGDYDYEPALPEVVITGDRSKRVQSVPNYLLRPDDSIPFYLQKPVDVPNNIKYNFGVPPTPTFTPSAAPRRKATTTATNTNVGTTAASVTTPSNTITSTPKRRAATKVTPTTTTTGITSQIKEQVAPEIAPTSPITVNVMDTMKRTNDKLGIPASSYEKPMETPYEEPLDKLKVFEGNLDSKGEVKPYGKGNGWWDASYLRYAPALGAGIGVLTDTLGLTNVPDYSDAEAIKAAADSQRNVSFTPIGDYMKYTPFDRLFYANQLGAQAGATRRNIMNTSGGNRGVAMAGLLGADYNTQNALGNLYRQAEEYNLGQREKVATFNRGTNQFNAEGDLKAQMANIDNNSNKVKAAIAAAELKERINDRIGRARSANLTNFFNSLGAIGEDTYNRNDTWKLIESGVIPTLSDSMRPQNMSNKKWDRYKATTKACGGKLNKRKKKGLTI